MKIRHITKYVGALSIVLFTTSGCEKYLDVNTNPNTPDKAAGRNILPVMLDAMELSATEDADFSIAQYIQFTGIPLSGSGTERHTGTVGASDGGGFVWRQHYWGIGINIDLIIADGVTKNNPLQTGIAKAIRAWSWQMLADVYGETIVKQAWESGRSTFAYDTQEEAYNEAAKWAKMAIADLNKATPANLADIASGDATYQGDAIKWRKFAYGVLAINANNISAKVGKYKSDDVIRYCDSSFTSNADNFMIRNDASTSLFANSMGPGYSGANVSGMRATSYVVGILDGTDGRKTGVRDPRLSIMIPATVSGKYRGVVSTLGDEITRTTDPFTTYTDIRETQKLDWIPPLRGMKAARTDLKEPGFWIFKDEASFPLMTYAEIQFIKAEAAFIKNDKSVAWDSYKKGIDASMLFTGVTATNSAAYMNSAAVASMTNLKISDIMMEKYIALFGHGYINTWTDLRKYAYGKKDNAYPGFILPDERSNTTGTGIVGYATDNLGKPAQRIRPRYNSEIVYNFAELERIGGTSLQYHTKPMWFASPN
ncbi:MAG: SusD/RagB family nutrient-binding outer membrane lipoprotein [Daejeonella sp.]